VGSTNSQDNFYVISITYIFATNRYLI
jgi:hypothetical protein